MSIWYDIERVIEIKSICTAFKTKYPENYYYEGEAHMAWELVCVLDGRACITAGSEIFYLKKGQAILHTPMEFHRITTENNNPEIAIIVFDAPIMPEIKSRIYSINPENMLLICGICDDVMKAFDYSSIEGSVRTLPGEELRANMVLLKTELLLLSVFQNFKVTKTETIESQVALNYMKIAKILEENVDKNLTIDDIAKLCNMSGSNVKKCFSKYSGSGVISYFNTLKIKKAMKLLGQGVSIEETAYNLGFSDRNYFSTVFKRISGYPPTHYKK